MDLSLTSTSTISSTPNQWPQPQISISSDDEKRSLIKAMEIKPSQDPLKCPRCDSCNTKFCYYNNYSLSQPRYFCKGCKRYWTRGGTLRNVPVGGGCRKNKRVRRAAPPSHGGGDRVSATVTNPPSKPNVQPEMDLSSTNNPSFYNPLELNFPFSRFSSTRVLDYQHQMSNEVGLGFSSWHENYENGLLDFVRNTNSSSSSSVYNPVFVGSSSGFSVATSTTGDLQRLAATSDNHEFSGLLGYDDMMQVSGFSENGVKIEGENGPNNYQINDQINSSDSSSILWNYSSNIGSWFDPNSNMGASVPSLI